jgi:hypothetical protein
MKQILLLLLAPVLFWVSPATAQSTFETKYAKRGLAGNQAQCPNKKSCLWVVVGGKGDCIRYYDSGLGGKNATVSVFFHGDWMLQRYKQEKRIFSSYSKFNSPKKMLGFAKS